MIEESIAFSVLIFGLFPSTNLKDVPHNIQIFNMRFSHVMIISCTLLFLEAVLYFVFEKCHQHILMHTLFIIGPFF